MTMNTNRMPSYFLWILPLIHLGLGGFCYWLRIQPPPEQEPGGFIYLPEIKYDLMAWTVFNSQVILVNFWLVFGRTSARVRFATGSVPFVL